ncbi:hypothetical protein CSKR_101479, partial [Clonorchis sinensis]
NHNAKNDKFLVETHFDSFGGLIKTRLLKILRQPTTGFALLGAHQVGAVPEFPSTMDMFIFFQYDTYAD